MRHPSKASLFLIELIVSILFFAIASALCIQIFVKAKQLDEEGLKQRHASIVASSIIETYRSNQLEQFYTVDQDGNIYFDQYWNPSTTTSIYKATITQDKNSLTVIVSQESTVLITLLNKHYQQRIF